MQSLARPMFEVIVVDDASTDDTAGAVALIRSMNPANVKLLLRPKNGGPAKALNDGIREAQGEWIKWLSADDVMYPSCLEDMLWHAKDKNAIYYSDYDYIDEEGKITGEFIEPGRPESDLWKLFFGNGSSSFIHRNVFEKCGLFRELPHSEDYEFWLRATQLFNVKLVRVARKTIQYRRHPRQLTNRVGGKLDKEIKASVRERLAEMLHPSG